MAEVQLLLFVCLFYAGDVGNVLSPSHIRGAVRVSVGRCRGVAFSDLVASVSYAGLDGAMFSFYAGVIRCGSFLCFVKDAVTKGGMCVCSGSKGFVGRVAFSSTLVIGSVYVIPRLRRL